jgi:transcriptional regulator with XRE-family HTH domain
MTAFADYLKDLRTSKRIGVRELGRGCGVTGMHISNMEKSQSESVTLDFWGVELSIYLGH